MAHFLFGVLVGILLGAVGYVGILRLRDVIRRS